MDKNKFVKQIVHKEYLQFTIFNLDKNVLEKTVTSKVSKTKREGRRQEERKSAGNEMIIWEKFTSSWNQIHDLWGK